MKMKKQFFLIKKKRYREKIGDKKLFVEHTLKYISNLKVTRSLIMRLSPKAQPGLANWCDSN